MSWARIMAPLSGGEGDAASVAAAARLAAPFDAELARVYTPADVADVMPWMGEGFLGGVQSTALESLKEAAAVGEAAASAAMDACGYAKKLFISLKTPVWAGLSAESRVSDVVVFNRDPARGRGPLAEAFQQMLADEQRPVLIAREGLKRRNRLSGGLVDETGYLAELDEIADSGLTPAERLLELYHGPWKGDVTKVFETFAY